MDWKQKIQKLKRAITTRRKKESLFPPPSTQSLESPQPVSFLEDEKNIKPTSLESKIEEKPKEEIESEGEEYSEEEEVESESSEENVEETEKIDVDLHERNRELDELELLDELLEKPKDKGKEKVDPLIGTVSSTTSTLETVGTAKPGTQTTSVSTSPMESLTERLDALQLEFSVNGFLQTISFPLEEKETIVKKYSVALVENGFTEDDITTLSTLDASRRSIRMTAVMGIEENHSSLFVAAAKVWKQRKARSQFFSGLPPLGERSGSSSGPSENFDHERAKLIERPFHMLKGIKGRNFNSRIWGGVSSSLEWGSESDIQGFVKLVMQDTIDAAYLDKELSCMNELGIFHVRADIWVVHKNGFPIGVVEVKKPGYDILTSEHVHGQIFDYMVRLRNFFGQKHVFGIVSTYKQWRIYWLANTDCDQAAIATTVDKSPLNLSLTNAIEVDVPEWLENIESDVEEVLLPPSQEKRFVHGTSIIGNEDRNLPVLLISVLLKMYHSPHTPVPLVRETQSYIQLNETSWYWTYFKKELNWSQMPSPQTKSLILLRDLRGGAHGRVWLASSSTGRVCVIKFANQANPLGTPQLIEEKNVWNQVWRLPARIQKFGGKDALVMPFVKPCTEKDHENKSVQELVNLAIERMAKEGFCHEDLHWRHVGLYKSKGKLTAILFDVAHISKVTDASLAITKMKTALQLA